MSDHKNDDLESARILMQENLLEEAKRVLFRLLARAPDVRAKKMLEQIEAIELNEIISKPVRSAPPLIEDADLVIQNLERDLQISIPTTSDERWSVNEVLGQTQSAQELFDLGVAFFEMGCYSDAIRELRKAEKKIRIESSFLGDLGVAVVALIAESMIKLHESFEAKVYLDPILLEPDLPHEQKLVLYYTMGVAEQELAETSSALGWYRKVMESDPAFRDVQQRVRLLTKT